RCSIGAVEQQEGESFASRQKRLVEAAEMRREAVAAELLRLRHREQFDEETRQLNHLVVRSPRMPIASADGEAEPAIKLCPGVEVAHGMDDVIEAARHCFRRYCRPCPVIHRPLV